ncbi:MAG: UDP-N-acetylmuramoyl-tripeptide--D-alanyl-D-alanine ligase, partial [Acidobacteria bacterium]
ARDTGGRLVAGDPARLARGVTIDSRRVDRDAVFFAIEGPRHDGHAYAGQAVQAGASVVVAARPLELPPGAALVLVDDTTAALGRLARAERRARGLRVVAVTGSAGKTTTRTLIAAALSGRYRTAASPGNLNNQWGLPLSILGLPDETEVAVLELAMNAPGEIAGLARIAEPDVGVITSIGTAHVGFFPDGIAGIARAKAELLAELPAGARAVLPAAARTLLAPLVPPGLDARWFALDDPSADIAGRVVSTSPIDGTTLAVGDTTVALRLWGRHAAENALAALAAAEALGLDPREAAPLLGAVEPMRGRGRVLRLAGDVLLVDESYNANPSAVRAVLDALAEARDGRRLVAVLGDMLELGDRAAALHREIGEHAARRGVGVLHAVGELAGELADAARGAGLPEVHVHADADAAAEALATTVVPGDLVLVKGSRGVGLERVVARLAESHGGREAC